MNRSQFLALLSALPFIKKPKPLLLKDCERATFKNCDKSKIKFYQEMMHFDGKFKITGEDLKAIIKC